MTKPGRILVVEDDRFLRRACEMSLQQRGFEVITAIDGEDGLQHARDDHPDAILLDLLMPKLPGIMVLQALKSDPSTAGIPVIILSNSSREEDRQQARELGAAGYYVKANLSLRQLAERVDRLLDAGRAAARGR
jgi:DNA-binding response OmpR family regulator